MVVRAGIHGDEVSGPFTLLSHLGSFVEAAHDAHVGLVVLPLDNPSGFEKRSRYNANDDRGSEGGGNNDFMRFERQDGSIVGELASGEDCRRWWWSSDPKLDSKLTRPLRLPQETLAVHRALKPLPLGNVVASIDLHQDNFCLDPEGKIFEPGAYHYGYGDSSRYSRIIERIASRVPILANRTIGSGYLYADAPPPPTSDERGYIVRYDGGFSDLFHWLGASHALTPETTGATPLEDAIFVNSAWLFGVLDLVRAENLRRK
jgi:hypothetical protein